MAEPTIITQILKIINPVHLPSISGLRPSAVKAHISGKVKPSFASIKKYTNAYRKINYNRLRAAGVNWSSANALKGGSLISIDDVVNRNNAFADFIVSSRNFEVDKATILESMSKSKKNTNDFEQDSM